MLRDSKGRFVKLIHGFKGFRRVWDEGLKAVVGKCLDKFYKSGETYEEADARLCMNGMHFCTNPLDVFSYYPPNQDCVYAPVTSPRNAMEMPSTSTVEYSKCCTKSLTIGNRFMDLSEYCDYIENNHVELGRRGNSDKGSVYVYNPDKEAGVAQAAHYCCIARNVESFNAAIVAGLNSVAITEAACSLAASLMCNSRAIGKDNEAIALAAGDLSSAEALSRGSIAIVTGVAAMAKGVVGSYLIVADWKHVGRRWHRAGFVSGFVDGSNIKADTWYAAMNGKLVESRFANEN